MLTYWNYFKARYLGEKGQGMVEYAVVVGVVVAIGIVVATSDKAGIAASIHTLYTTVFDKAATSLK